MTNETLEVIERAIIYYAQKHNLYDQDQWAVIYNDNDFMLDSDTQSQSYKVKLVLRDFKAIESNYEYKRIILDRDISRYNLIPSKEISFNADFAEITEILNEMAQLV